MWKAYNRLSCKTIINSTMNKYCKYNEKGKSSNIICFEAVCWHRTITFVGAVLILEMNYSSLIQFKQAGCGEYTVFWQHCGPYTGTYTQHRGPCIFIIPIHKALHRAVSRKLSLRNVLWQRYCPVTKWSGSVTKLTKHFGQTSLLWVTRLHLRMYSCYSCSATARY